jgi:hypothetical protein
VPGLTQEAVTPAETAEAQDLVEQFAGQLQRELKGAITDGGPQSAVLICQERAPAIAAALADASGWTIGRTSLRPRNVELNTPDAWERAVLEQFDARKAAGEDPATMIHAEVVETEEGPAFRYMKAIPTAQLCLTCHGKAINASVTEALDAAYPHDQARGYLVGDIRGAFSLEKWLETAE